MVYRVLADALVLFHLAFILFVVLGGLLVLRWRRVAWGHIPCALWGVWVEFAGWVCPVTPLEVRLRILGGEAGYSGGFVENYVLPVIYPRDLTRELQVWLGILVVAANVVAYGLAVRRDRTQSRSKSPGLRERQKRMGPRGSSGSDSQG